MKKTIFVAFLSLGIMACASFFKRKDCEKINWFEHGKNVALSGKRMNEDQTVHDCRKVEAEMNEAALDNGYKAGMQSYCELDTVYRNGRRGEIFNPDLCDSGKLKSLRQKHAEGVREYCRPSNGISAGATGKPYNNICPKDLEDKFIPEFNKGRKQYLTAKLEQAKNDLNFAQTDLNSLESQRRDVSFRLERIQSRTRLRITPPPGSNQTAVEVSDGSDQEAERLKNELWRVDDQIRTKRTSVEQFRQDIRDLTTELTKVP